LVSICGLITPFQVSGVLEGEGRSFDGGDVGDMVLVPITTARATLIRSPFPRNVHYLIAQGKR
jgi:putative ABC transport system permease protein